MRRRRWLRRHRSTEAAIPLIIGHKRFGVWYISSARTHSDGPARQQRWLCEVSTVFSAGKYSLNVRHRVDGERECQSMAHKLVIQYGVLAITQKQFFGARSFEYTFCHLSPIGGGWLVLPKRRIRAAVDFNKNGCKINWAAMALVGWLSTPLQSARTCLAKDFCGMALPGKYPIPTPITTASQEITAAGCWCASSIQLERAKNSNESVFPLISTNGINYNIVVIPIWVSK